VAAGQQCESLISSPIKDHHPARNRRQNTNPLLREMPFSGPAAQQVNYHKGHQCLASREGFELRFIKGATGMCTNASRTFSTISKRGAGEQNGGTISDQEWKYVQQKSSSAEVEPRSGPYNECLRVQLSPRKAVACFTWLDLSSAGLASCWIGDADSLMEYFSRHQRARQPSGQPIFLPSSYVRPQ
jgi:hypothetical protein